MGKNRTIRMLGNPGVDGWSGPSEAVTRSTRWLDGSGCPRRWSDGGYDVRQGNGSIEWTGRAGFLDAANP